MYMKISVLHVEFSSTPSQRIKQRCEPLYVESEGANAN